MPWPRLQFFSFIHHLAKQKSHSIAERNAMMLGQLKVLDPLHHEFPLQAWSRATDFDFSEAAVDFLKL